MISDNKSEISIFLALNSEKNVQKKIECPTKGQGVNFLDRIKVRKGSRYN
jgi:hypothetical protein